MKMRIRRVRDAFAKERDPLVSKAVQVILDECLAVADLCNQWAHDPLLPFGKEGTLHRWEISSGEFAGIMVPVDVPLLDSLLPHLRQLHVKISNLAALLHGPGGKAHALVFGPDTPETDLQVKALVAQMAVERQSRTP